MSFVMGILGRIINILIWAIIWLFVWGYGINFVMAFIEMVGTARLAGGSFTPDMVDPSIFYDVFIETVVMFKLFLWGLWVSLVG